MNVFELFKESFGVGVVASKKQAKDPRYSHSLTKDVRPDTPKKNQKALGLTEEVGRQSDDDKYLLDLLAQIGAAEGKYFGKGSQNSLSSARGRYQFTKGTWEGIQENIKLGKYKNYGIPQELLDDIVNTSHQDMADPKKPDFSKRIQDAAALIGAKENARRLEKAGINVDRDNLYKTWALGPSTGIKVIQAKGTGKSMEDIYKEVYGPESRDEEGNLKWEKRLNKTKEQNPTWFKKGDSADAIGGFLNDHIAKLNKDRPAPEVTVSTTPNAEEKPKQSVDAIATLQTAFQKAMKDGDGKAMNDILQNVKALGGDKAMQSVAKNEYKAGDISPERQNRAAVDATQSRLDKEGKTPGDRAMDAEIAKDDAIYAELGGVANVQDLAKANNIKDANKIQVGQKIKMPDGSEITVKPGDTMSKITADYNKRKPAEKSYAEQGKEELPSSMSVKQAELDAREIELAAAEQESNMAGGGSEEQQRKVERLKKDVDDAKKSIAFLKDLEAGKGGAVGQGTLNAGDAGTAGEADYLKAKDASLAKETEAKELEAQGKTGEAEAARREAKKLDMSSLADDDLNRRRAQAKGNQLEADAAAAQDRGDTEEAERLRQESEKANAEAKEYEQLEQMKRTRGITMGQGSKEEQMAALKQWDKIESEGGDPTASWPGGAIKDPEKKADFIQRQTDAVEKQKEEGTFDVDKTIDDFQSEIDYEEPDYRRGDDDYTPEPKPEPEPNVDMSDAGKADKDDPFFNYGDAGKPEPEVKVDTTKKEVEPEEIKFDEKPQRQHYKDKYSALTPAFMMDEPDKEAVYARERVKKDAAELMRSNPAEYNRKYGGNKLGAAIDTAEQEAYKKYDAPSPKDETPVVDTTPKKDTTSASVPPAEERPAQSSIGNAISSSSGSGMAAAKAQDDAAKAAADKARQEAEAKAAQDRARSSGNVQVGMAGAGTNLGKDNASQQAQDLQKQKAEADARKAEQEAAAAKQKAEEEAKKAEQERQRQAANNTRVGPTSSGLTNAYNVRKKVPESAIFRAIMRK